VRLQWAQSRRTTNAEVSSLNSANGRFETAASAGRVVWVWPAGACGRTRRRGDWRRLLAAAQDPAAGRQRAQHRRDQHHHRVPAARASRASASAGEEIRTSPDLRFMRRRLPIPSTTNVRCGWKRCTRRAGQIKRCTLHRNGPLARARHRGRWQRPPGLDTVCSSLSSIVRI
jgi:hypothetical protein